MKENERAFLNRIIENNNKEIKNLKKLLRNNLIEVTDSENKIYYYNTKELIKMLNKQFEFMKFEIKELEKWDLKRK